MENRRKIGDINASLQDTLSGIRVVQSFANEDLEREKFKKSNHAFLLSKNDNYHCMGSFMSSNLFFQGLMYLITLVYGGYLIARGQMQAADLAMYALYIGIFISPIQILVELVEMMQKGLSGFRRFLDVMETVPEIQDAPDAVDLTNVKGRVCYEDVSFHYSDDDTTVLSNVSIEIPAGQICRSGRSFRQRKDYDLFSAAPLLRCDSRTHYDRRPGYPPSHPEKPAFTDWYGTAGCLPVLRNDP